MSTVRDKLWLFASRAHDDDRYLGRDGLWCRSRITPAEGAMMLDVPNVIMVNSDGIPVPFSEDAYGYAESFCRMKNVVWSIVGSGGFRIGNEEDFICALADRYPNVTGAFADDFLGAAASTDKTDEEKRRIIQGVRRKFQDSGHKLEMWLTVYTRDIETCSAELYGMFDCLTLWTWEYEKLRDLRRNFETMERRFPRQKKYIGIYIINYPTGKAIPDEYMELQCEFGLEMLRQKRADGLIFLTNCVMGIGLSSEYWLRNWIDRVKDERLD